MRIILFLSLILLFCAFGAIAQEPSSLSSANETKTATTATVAQSGNSDDFKPFEIYIGYSFAKSRFGKYEKNPALNIPALGNTFKRSEAFNGFEIAGVYNFSRYLGAKADFSLHENRGGRRGRLRNTNFEVKERLTTFMAGIQVKDNSSESENRFRPFAHALFGVANASSQLKGNTCTAAFGTPCPRDLTRGKTGFAGAVGGGLDIKLNNSITLRVVQVDYLYGRTAKGLRLGAGIVF